MGGEWVRYNANFDNIVQSVITMFTMMTTEGWVETLWHATDSTEIYQVPIRNANPYNVIFFMIFLLIGSLILLNAFVGVVVISFGKEKTKLTSWDKLTALQHLYCDVSIMCYSSKPVKQY